MNGVKFHGTKAMQPLPRSGPAAYWAATTGKDIPSECQHDAKERGRQSILTFWTTTSLSVFLAKQFAWVASEVQHNWGSRTSFQSSKLKN